MPANRADQASSWMFYSSTPPIGVPLKPWNNEEQTLWEVRTWYLGKSFDREQLLRRVGYDRFFDGGLIWKGQRDSS